MSDSDTKAALLKELWLRFQKLSLGENSDEKPFPQDSALDKTLSENDATEELITEKSAQEETSSEHAFPENLSLEESSPDNVQNDHASIDNALPESTSPEKLLTEKSAPDTTSPKKSSAEAYPLWFLCPQFDGQVQEQLEDAYINYYTFYPHDSERAIRSYNTNIMGRFICVNKKCSREQWHSKMVAIVIRQYHDDQYNARVYNQRCVLCNKPGQPKVDEISYVDRVAYRIKKWNGVNEAFVPKERQRYLDAEASDGTHRPSLCEGCKRGLCKGQDATEEPWRGDEWEFDWRGDSE